ncbi:uncharacterized protein [Cicer arietinum]|uniref:Uncharacterized protein LOC105851627 n=1 Tax=Cicer arietinum TaxID=3827 RepID=A0A1S3DZZ3_CICAR|nr:uncharacterized protein LOC105851627 [Cicer arietinum]
MPTPCFVPKDNISPIVDHSPSQPLTYVVSRHTSISANPPPSTPVTIGNKTQGSRCSNSSHGVAPDGRTMIWPDGREWLPCRVASRVLTSVIKSQYVDPYPSWRAIPELTLERWFGKFGEKVVWFPEHNFQIKNIFNTKGSMRLSDMLMQARKKCKCPNWMGETIWNDLEKIWMDPSYKEISNRAKKNCVSSKGGHVHIGGSISIAEHTIRMETFQSKLQQASKGGEASSSYSQVVNAEARLDMWVQSVGGKNKGRIYGAGDRSLLYRPGVTSLAESSRRHRHPDYDEDESSDGDGEE